MAAAALAGATLRSARGLHPPRAVARLKSSASSAKAAEVAGHRRVRAAGGEVMTCPRRWPLILYCCPRCRDGTRTGSLACLRKCGFRFGAGRGRWAPVPGLNAYPAVGCGYRSPSRGRSGRPASHPGEPGHGFATPGSQGSGAGGPLQLLLRDPAPGSGRRRNRHSTPRLNHRRKPARPVAAAGRAAGSSPGDSLRLRRARRNALPGRRSGRSRSKRQQRSARRQTRPYRS